MIIVLIFLRNGRKQLIIQDIRILLKYFSIDGPMWIIVRFNSTCITYLWYEFAPSNERKYWKGDWCCPNKQQYYPWLWIDYILISVLYIHYFRYVWYKYNDIGNIWKTAMYLSICHSLLSIKGIMNPFKPIVADCCNGPNLGQSCNWSKKSTCLAT